MWQIPVRPGLHINCHRCAVTSQNYAAVYVARGLDTGIIKVGSTANLHSRLVELCYYARESIELVAVVWCCCSRAANAEELRCHHALATSRAWPRRGREWFHDDSAFRVWLDGLTCDRTLAGRRYGRDVGRNSRGRYARAARAAATLTRDDAPTAAHRGEA